MAGRSKDTAPPILLMKTGAIGAEPRGFYSALAAAYNATDVSPQLVDVLYAGFLNKRPRRDAVRAQVAQSTEALLEQTHAYATQLSVAEVTECPA